MTTSNKTMSILNGEYFSQMKSLQKKLFLTVSKSHKYNYKNITIIK